MNIRPKDVFLPVAKGSKNAGDAEEEDANFRSRRGGPLGGSSGGGAAFGKKK